MIQRESISIVYIILSGILSAMGYGYMAVISGESLHAVYPEDGAITHFLVTMGFLFLLYGFLVAKMLRGEFLSSNALFVSLLWCLLFRLILVPTDLILENDLYRYLWDGHIWQQGINPFQYPPDADALEPYRTDYWSLINYPHVPTVYPPTLQVVFYLANWVFPGSVVGMKWVFVLFDTATIGLLYLLLQKLSLPKEWCLIYAWSPLVIKEIANSGHADAVSACLFVLVIYLLADKRSALSAVVMALFILTKFFGVLLLPLFLRFWRIRDFAVFAVVIVIMYIPFLQWDIHLFAGFITFSNEWRFNAGLFAVVETLLIQYNLAGYFQAETFTRYIMFCVILMVTLWQSVLLFLEPSVFNWIRRAFIIVGTLLLCSPVINSWYLVWILPLICLRPNRAWIVFTALVFLTYTYYYEWLFMNWVKPVEFGLFFILLIDDWLWNTVSDGSYDIQSKYT